MKTSDAGLKLIAEFEGFGPKLYNDPAGHCTIGYGHLLHLGNCDGRAEEIPFQGGISEREARDLLALDIVRYEAFVEQFVLVPLSQGQFDALVSFCYNVGGGGLQQSSVLTAVNEGRFEDVCTELRKFVHAVGFDRPLPGLVRRREAECKLFGSMEEEEMTALALMHEAGAYLFLASDIGQGFQPNERVCAELLVKIGDGSTLPVKTKEHGQNLCIYAASEILRGGSVNSDATKEIRFLLKTRPQLA
jgi:GH24 family phage-related lysozyme (muramidase)